MKESALEKLKSEAYDALVQIEMWQTKLKDVSQQIKDFKPEVTDKKDGK